MKITGEQHYDVPRDQVWDAILDPEILSRILPGCEDLKATGDNEFSGKLKMKVGPVQGLFQGKVTLSDLDPPTSYRMKIDGRGAPGFMKGDGLLALEEDGDGTLLRYDIDAQVGGRIASVGQRLLESSAKVITRQGLDGLGVQLDALAKPQVEGSEDAAKADESAAMGEESENSDSEGEATPSKPSNEVASPPEAPSQTKFLAAVVAGVAGDLLPKESRPWIALTTIFLLIALVFVFLRGCS